MEEKLAQQKLDVLVESVSQFVLLTRITRTLVSVRILTPVVPGLNAPGQNVAQKKAVVPTEFVCLVAMLVKIHLPASVEILLVTVELVTVEISAFPARNVRPLEIVKTFVILVSRTLTPVSVKVMEFFKPNALLIRDVSTEIVFLFVHLAKQTRR